MSHLASCCQSFATSLCLFPSIRFLAEFDLRFILLIQYLCVAALSITATGTLAAQSLDWRVPDAADKQLFVWPGSQEESEASNIWGLRNGIQVGLSPTPGPEGLLRIYTPYLGNSHPRVINFISIEPAVAGQRGRGQSELERSPTRGNKPGLTFWASGEKDAQASTLNEANALISKSGKQLRFYVHTEKFRNGALPIIEITIDRDHPHEIQFATFVHEDSAKLASCTLSATMGNYGQLRVLETADGTPIEANQLWGETDRLDRLGFLDWHSWKGDRFPRDPRGRMVAVATTDSEDPASEDYAEGTPKHWVYQGQRARQAWKADPDDHLRIAVNGRLTYWMSDKAIPGGAAFENFEIAVPFQSGRKLWFEIEVDPATKE